MAASQDVVKPSSRFRVKHGKKHKIPLIPTLPQAPQIQQLKDGTQVSLFLSTTLLKSHRSLVQFLEGMENTPTLVYRDYNYPKSSKQVKSIQTQQNFVSDTLACEADIIVSPTTGVILTASQAINQLYLPGHKPNDPEIKTIQEINSPLRERIFRLAHRYERLYIFISHSPVENRDRTVLAADKGTLASVASLTAFCTSLSSLAIVIPLMISSLPYSHAEWILALAHKHATALPNTERDILPSGFTAINVPVTTTDRKKTNLHLTFSPEETPWEIFLRRAGLNPFAAQMVLADLGHHNGHGPRYKSDGSHMHFCKEDSVLSRFIELDSEARARLFSEVVGMNTIKRIGDVIDCVVG
ncbi:hypothetical protein ASPZODRAFT_134379 [Penicilliopsis zonata CBS 506.65]|uniref:Uncharacterized protein n=1 Tax=Penicilliopsis zonata CBS 506.65 TaxID=1073090 RepID=A0A1L9SCU8_9EURO|nr:hypothetical protein ASPZODRAFT_134379 [Penicilliopsis zonata CBS 506.65]OJJ44959.1 hypothetical protein ASPZODRAFT_134379 [Penicilliopsis zonata CBS 506.65]